jgi:GNAT superfamily N-acetyltransferase
MLRTLSGDTGRAEALVATRAGVIIGHAMAADHRGPDGILMTDIGVVVADAWQGHGVGAALIRALIAAATDRGVAALTMDVQHSNRRVLAMIASHWPGACKSRGTDGIIIKIMLPSRPDTSRPDTGPAVASYPAAAMASLSAAQARQGLALPG